MTANPSRAGQPPTARLPPRLFGKAGRRSGGFVRGRGPKLRVCLVFVLALGAAGWDRPSVAVNGDDETVVVVEADGAVGGLVFGPGGEPRTLTPLPLATGTHAHVAAAPDGRAVAVVYVLEGQTRLIEGLVTDAGLGFGQEVAADPAEEQQYGPRVAFHGPDRLFLAWADDRRGPRGLSVQLRRTRGTVVVPRVEAAAMQTAVLGGLHLDGNELVLAFVDRGARDVLRRKVLDPDDEALAVLEDGAPLFTDRGDTRSVCAASWMGVTIVGQVDGRTGLLGIAITDGGDAPRATDSLPLAQPGGCAAIADADGYTVMAVDGPVLRALRFDAVGERVGQWGLRLGPGSPLRNVAAARRENGSVVAFTYGAGEVGVVFLGPEPNDQQRCDQVPYWFQGRTCCIDGDWVIEGDVAEGGCLVCDPDAGDTQWTCQDSGVACDEHDLCTEGTCTADCTCEIGWERDCAHLDRPCWAGGCVAETGECRPFLAQQLAPCDPDPCTVDGVCEWGVCRGGRPKDCRDLNRGCDIGICNQGSGQCEVEVRNDGETCQPVDPCFAPGVCAGGECQSAVEVDCSGIDRPCYAGVCDATSGACREVLQPDGTPCDDNNACTDEGTCRAGLCQEGVATDDDGDGICSNLDNCPAEANPEQSDADLDGRGDLCDACPSDPASTPTGCPVPVPTPDAGTPDAGAAPEDLGAPADATIPPAPSARARTGGCN